MRNSVIRTFVLSIISTHKAVIRKPTTSLSQTIILIINNITGDIRLVCRALHTGLYAMYKTDQEWAITVIHAKVSMLISCKIKAG